MIVQPYHHPDRGPMIELGLRSVASWCVDMRAAARLLAGLEVALAAALREAGRGKCLRCGRVASTVYATPSGMTPHEEIMCGWCGGVLSPVLTPRRWEREKEVDNG